MKKWKTALAASLVLACASTQAALVSRGGGLLYDTVLNVTWLQDANYSKTSGYDLDGQMTWHEAIKWASELEYFDSVRGATYRDWRLPSVSPVNGNAWDYSWSTDGLSSDRSYNITNPKSELSYMYYVNLGLFGEYSPQGALRTDFGVFGIGTYAYGGQADLGLVKNLQNAAYWTEVELGRNPYVAPASDYAWWFNNHVGSQYFAVKAANVYAWAVRDGDVATVPEPSSFILSMLGLLLIWSTAWRRASLKGRST